METPVDLGDGNRDASAPAQESEKSEDHRKPWGKPHRGCLPKAEKTASEQAKTQ